MNPVVVRGLQIGEGTPKICVPIVEKNEENIIETAKKILDSPADLVEWRADWFEEIFDFNKVSNVLKSLREILGNIPILFTFRTKEEGGEKLINKAEYLELNKKVIDSGYVDLVDIQIFQFQDITDELISYAHAIGAKVIVSNHDFQKTPKEEEIVFRLTMMQETGADILKMAVMPNSNRDVLSLLSATEKVVKENVTKPVVTMSMSEKGMISRIAGETFGSAITFGTVGQASAPGQFPASELKRILELLKR